MARGKNRSQLLGIQGGILSDKYGDWDFIYETSTAKSNLYNIGDRVVLPDGRVFRYAYTSATVQSYHGAASSLDKALGYEVAAVTQAIGDRTVTITETGFTKDQLRGGYIVIYGASDAAQNRGIVGNDVSGSTTTKIYLDAPLTVVVTAASTGIEMFYNPYSSIEDSNTEYSPIMGLPAVSAAASTYVWIQTWGPCVISGGENVGAPAANARTLMFGGGNGALYKNATLPYAQIAGFIMTKGTAAYGPLIMLQISP